MCGVLCTRFFFFFVVVVSPGNQLPSTMTTQLVSSVPCTLVATHRYLPESSGLQSRISNVITPSVWVMVKSRFDSSLVPRNHWICCAWRASAKHGD